jgi:hypothetical protein
VDGLSGFSNAIEAVFPKTEMQKCIIHQIRNITRFVSFKDIRSLMTDLKWVYTAPTEDAALRELATFDENRAKNILKFRIPGETTGLNSPPISNIPRKFEPSFIQPIPLRDSTGSSEK